MLDLSDGCLNSLVVDLKEKKLCYPFLWMGFNCLKATETLRGGSLLFDPGNYWNIGYVAKKLKKKMEDFQIGFYSVDSAYCFISRTNLSLINQILVLVVIEH